MVPLRYSLLLSRQCNMCQSILSVFINSLIVIVSLCLICSIRVWNTKVVTYFEATLPKLQKESERENKIEEKGKKKDTQRVIMYRQEERLICKPIELE